MDSIVRQLESAVEEERRQAVVTLAGLPFSQVKQHLYGALGDESWRVRKEAVDAVLSAAPGGETIAEIVDLLAVPENAGLHNAAVEILQSLGQNSLPYLCDRLTDKDPGVRKFVVDILGGIGSAAAVPRLLQALDDPDPNVAAAAAEGLGAIGAAEAVPLLVRSLEKEDLLLRYSVLEALTRIGKPVPMAVLAPLASLPLLKKAVFDCLRMVGTVEAMPLLIGGVTERARNVRNAAVLALATIYQRSAGRDADAECRRQLAQLAGSPVVDVLVSMVGGDDLALKRAAIILLGLAGDTQTVVPLLQECRNEEFYDTCLQAFRDFGVTGIRALVERFSVADDEERCIILHICGEVGAVGMESLLETALRDRFPMVRRFAAESVGKARVVGLVHETANLLDDPSADVRRSVINALARLATAAHETVAAVASQLAVSDRAEKRLDGTKLLAALADHDRLALMAKDADPSVRRTAIASLGNLRNPDSISPLSLALTDEEADVRVAAATALGQVGGSAALATLLMALGDGHPWVQVAALKSLARLAEPTTLPTITTLAKSAEGIVQITALETMVEIAGEMAIPHLVEATASADTEVSKAALDLLQRFPDGWLREVGERLLTHESRSIRRKVASLLVERCPSMALTLLERAAVNETDEMTRRYLLDLVDKVQ